MDLQTLPKRLDNIIQSDKERIARVQRNREYLIKLLKKSSLTTSKRIKINQSLEKLDDLIQASKERIPSIESKQKKLTRIIEQSNLGRKIKKNKVFKELLDLMDELEAFQDEFQALEKRAVEDLDDVENLDDLEILIVEELANLIDEFNQTFPNAENN